MPAATYAIIRFVADPWRDEPINVGIIVAGTAGALASLDPAALGRMQAADSCLDPAILEDVQEYVSGILSEPIVQVRDGRVERIAPDEPEYLVVLSEQLPRRFALGRVLQIELADTRRETMDQAATELLSALVAPSTARAATAS